MEPVRAKQMDRVGGVLKHHLSANTKKLMIRQTRRGCLQECLGCEAKTEFKFFKEGETKNEFATGLEDSNLCCRLCCAPNHSFKMSVKETGTNAQLLSVDRPFACSVSPCKCCCRQKMTVTGDGTQLGSIKETFWCCVPRFVVDDETGKEIYKLHQPTCCGGMCVNCCAEGNPCGKGCCKSSFRVYPASQDETDGDSPYDGVILVLPKSAATELFTDANAFEVTYPDGASRKEKALLTGSAIFFNAVFFESNGGG